MYEQDPPRILSGNGPQGREEITAQDHPGTASEDAGWNMPKKGTTGIYCITNTKNGKRYIGSAAECMRQRWRRHLSDLRLGRHHSKHLQRAWALNGEQVFTFEVLVICHPEDCIIYEQSFMDSYQSANYKHGYNIMPEAGSCRGRIVSEETRAKIGASAKGRKQSPETLARKSAALKGLKRTLETLLRLSAARKGKKFSPERLARYREERRTRGTSDETRAKISAAGKMRKISPEHVAALAEGRRKRRGEGQISNP